MSLVSAIVVVKVPRETIAFNQHRGMLLESMALGSLDHISPVADFLCFLDCSS